MRNRNSIDIVAILTATAAFAVIFLSYWEFGPPVDQALHSEIGRVLAKEALSSLPPGGQITVITRDTEAFPQPALDILLKSFQQEVRRGGDFRVGTQVIQLDPLRPVEVPPGDFYELIRRSAPERIIVSLLGPPVLTPEQRGALGRVKPTIIAFCSGNLAETLDLQKLFNAGLLHVALINKPPSPGTADTLPNGARTFERLYTVVRTDAATVREPSRAGR